MEKSCLTCESGEPEERSEGYYCSQRPENHKISTVDPGGICRAYEPRKEPTKMSKQTAIINHQHMWDWLSENPEASKSNYMLAHNVDPRPAENCFLCQYARENHPWSCKRDCLLVWPGINCQSEESPFSKWDDTTNPSHRAELARQIRDLPERGEEPFYVIDPATFGEPGIGKTVVMEGPAINALGACSAAIEPPPKLTRAEAIAKTREQWRWYAMNPLAHKEKYFEEHGLKPPKENCYLCEYTRGDCLDTPKPDTCGKICPLRWPGDCCVLKHRSGLYDLWIDQLHTPELRQSVAWLISRLPEKPVKRIYNLNAEE